MFAVTQSPTLYRRIYRKNEGLVPGQYKQPLMTSYYKQVTRAMLNKFRAQRYFLEQWLLKRGPSATSITINITRA